MSKFPFIANEFSGKRALVTGGTAGIGEAIASRLLDGGANVITTSRNSKSDHERRKHSFIEADLSTSEGCAKVINEVSSQFGGVDILVNVLGASFAPSGGFSVLTDAEWQKELNIHLLAAVRLDRGLLPSMIKQESGVIIHFSSIQRRLPLYEATLAYAAAKAALTTYSKGLSKEVGPKGVRVNSVAPGFIETSAAQGLIEPLAKQGGTDMEAARHELVSIEFVQIDVISFLVFKMRLTISGGYILESPMLFFQTFLTPKLRVVVNIVYRMFFSINRLIDALLAFFFG